MDEERLNRLGQIINDAVESNDIEEALALNNLFHTTIYEAADQPLIVDLIQSLRNKVAPYNRLYMDLEGKKDQAWIAHQRIYAACQARDGEQTEQETRQHLKEVFDIIITSLSRP